MTYTVVQKNRNNYYLYEVTAVWDSSKKRSVQKRVYKGKCDSEGNLIQSTGKSDIVSKDYGEYHLFFDIGDKEKLNKIVNSYTDEKSAALLLAIAITRATRSCPPTHSLQKIEQSIIPIEFDIPNGVRLNDLFDILIKIDKKRHDIFADLVEGDSAVVYADMGLTNPVRFYRLYGKESHFNFNRYPSKTILFGVNSASQNPFYFHTANSDIIDKTILKDVTRDLNSMGVKDVTFFFDRSTYDEYDYVRLLDNDYKVTALLDKCSPLFQSINVSDPNFEFTHVFEGTVFRYSVKDIDLSNNKCKAIIAENSKIREGMTLSLYSDLELFKDTVSKMKWNGRIEDTIADNHGMGQLIKFFKLSKSEDGKVVAEYDYDKIREYESNLGRMVFITNSNNDF